MQYIIGQRVFWADDSRSEGYNFSEVVEVKEMEMRRAYILRGYEKYLCFEENLVPSPFEVSETFKRRLNKLPIWEEA